MLREGAQQQQSSQINNINRHILQNPVNNSRRLKPGVRVPLKSLRNRNAEIRNQSQSNAFQKTIKLPQKSSTNDQDSKTLNCPKLNIFEDENLPLLPKNVTDVDSDNTTHASGMDTVKENYFYLLYQQEITQISSEFPYNPPNYTSATRLVDSRMRSTLLDWALSCCEKLQLNIQTTYLGVWILDRFLDECNSPKMQAKNSIEDSSKNPSEKVLKVDKQNLQLVGVASFVIASKYEELEYPMLDDWVFLTADSCSREDIMMTELEILKRLQFNVNAPTPIQFLRRFGLVTNVDQEIYTIAKFFLESTIYDCELSKVRASDRALACLVLAGKLKEKEFWNQDLRYYSQSDDETLEKIIGMVSRLMIQTVSDVLNRNNKKCKTMSVYKKYAKETNFEVSTSRDVVGIKIRSQLDLQRNEKMTDNHIKQIQSNCIIRINPILNRLAKM